MTYSELSGCLENADGLLQIGMEIKKTDEEETFPINWFVRTYTGGLFSGGYMNQG